MGTSPTLFSYPNHTFTPSASFSPSEFAVPHQLLRSLSSIDPATRDIEDPADRDLLDNLERALLEAGATTLIAGGIRTNAMFSALREISCDVFAPAFSSEPKSSSQSFPNTDPLNDMQPSTQHITHVFHTADPIPMGTCTGVTSSCGIAGYAMETRCHLGKVIRYDTVKSLLLLCKRPRHSKDVDSESVHGVMGGRTPEIL
jgi:hypothetical protein